MHLDYPIIPKILNLKILNLKILDLKILDLKILELEKFKWVLLFA